MNPVCCPMIQPIPLSCLYTCGNRIVLVQGNWPTSNSSSYLKIGQTKLHVIEKSQVEYKVGISFIFFLLPVQEAWRGVYTLNVIDQEM